MIFKANTSSLIIRMNKIIMLKPSKIIKGSKKIITTKAMTKIIKRRTTITIIIKITLINMIRTTSNSLTQWKKILFPTIKLIVIKKK